VDQTIFWLAFMLPLIFTVGGLFVILMAMRQRHQTLEMKHRERLAMIEKGMVPNPGADPAAFEMWQQRHDSPPARATSIGVVIVALGLGLALMIGFAGNEPDVAIGIGGAIVVVGLAFIVNGEMQRRSHPPRDARYSATPPRPLGPSDPSTPVGP
jgi:hypothetical protein